MKPYLPSDKIVVVIERLLQQVPSGRVEIFERVVTCLCQGRRYRRAGIYLCTSNGLRAATASGKERYEHAVVTPIRIAGRVLGELRVEPDPQHGWGGEDRVLLKRVAAQLARFLTGKGKPVLLSFRQSDSQAKRRGAFAGEQSGT